MQRDFHPGLPAARAAAEGGGAIRPWVDGYVLTKFLHDSLVK